MFKSESRIFPETLDRVTISQLRSIPQITNCMCGIDPTSLNSDS